MKIIMTEKYYFGYWQGWTITIDGVKYPIASGHVYTKRSAIDALRDCFEECNNLPDVMLTTALAQTILAKV